MPAKTQLKELLDGFRQETELKKSSIEPETPIETKKERRKVPPSRRGKRHISGYFAPEVLRQVKRLS